MECTSQAVFIIFIFLFHLVLLKSVFHRGITGNKKELDFLINMSNGFFLVLNELNVAQCSYCLNTVVY